MTEERYEFFKHITRSVQNRPEEQIELYESRLEHCEDSRREIRNASALLLTAMGFIYLIGQIDPPDHGVVLWILMVAFWIPVFIIPHILTYMYVNFEEIKKDKEYIQFLEQEFNLPKKEVVNE